MKRLLKKKKTNYLLILINLSLDKLKNAIHISL